VIGGRVLDVSAVLTLAAGTNVYGQAVLRLAIAEDIPLAVPAAALQAAWQHASPAGRPWLELLPDNPTVVVVPLDLAQARDSGTLAADAGRPDVLAGTAHAVHLAVHRNWPLITAEPDTALALSSRVRTETIP
jgi:hypothetical protein